MRNLSKQYTPVFLKAGEGGYEFEGAWPSWQDSFDKGEERGRERQREPLNP